MNSFPNQRFHVGVYGILINNNKILLIKKSRGAYKGMYDLPGGGIEFGEKIEEALRREFVEEAGINLENQSFVGHSEYFCEYLNDANKSRELHHLGLYYRVSASFDKIKSYPDGQDSLGAEFIEIDKLHRIEIAQIAKPIIDKVLNSL